MLDTIERFVVNYRERASKSLEQGNLTDAISNLTSAINLEPEKQFILSFTG